MQWLGNTVQGAIAVEKNELEHSPADLDIPIAQPTGCLYGGRQGDFACSMG
jgi:hypothetical protein